MPRPKRKRGKAPSLHDRPLASFGRRLRQARRAAGLSQQALADRTGYDQVSLSRAEAGHITPRLSTILRLCQALEVEAGILLGAPSGAHTVLEAANAEFASLWKAVSAAQQSVMAIHDRLTALEHDLYKKSRETV